MAAKIQFRRGLNADRTGVVFDAGEPAWASDAKQLWVGDGSTAGGKQVAMWGDSPTFAGLTASGPIVSTSTSAVVSATTATTNAKYGSITNTGGQIYFGVESSVAGSFFTGAAAYEATVYAVGSLYLYGSTGVRINPGSGVAAFLGAAPGTPGSNQVLIGGGAGAFAAGVRSYLGGAAFEAIGAVGSPSYLRIDQTANSGKAWRVGHTGAAGGYTTFDIYNQTDGVTALSFAATGVASFGGTIITSGNVRAGLIELGSGGELRLPGYDGDTDIAVNYTGYNGGTTRFRSVKFYDGKQALIATLDGETKTATFGGKVVFGAGTYSAGVAHAYTTAGDGLVIIGKTGTTTDLVLTNGSGSTVLEAPAGTTNAKFCGTVIAAGATAPGTPGSNQVLVGGGEVKAAEAITTVGFVADNGTLNSVSHYAGAAATDEKWWRWQNGSAVGSGVLRLRALNDALTDGINAITFSRNGISSVTTTFGGDIVSGGSFYFGDRLTDGTWRLRRDGSDLVLEHRQSGSYVEASRWVPPV